MIPPDDMHAKAGVFMPAGFLGAPGVRHRLRRTIGLWNPPPANSVVVAQLNVLHALPILPYVLVACKVSGVVGSGVYAKNVAGPQKP